ncbi:MAG: adenosylcobinamide-GDP ribazoletransferase [Firmicutes bacterium]|nr:adenosylcobinamide-GDP ribazoletransferase [Bacillota bacterium]
MRSLVAAFRFLTRIPLPGPATQVEDIGRAVGWFPLVGAFVGLVTAGVFLGARQLWPASIAAVLAIGAGLLLTGGFHEDGATDATDGLGGGWTRQRVLEIMKDSRIGAYGAMALWCLLAFRWAALVTLEQRALVAFPFAMVLGRWSIAFVLSLLPPIGQGLAKEVHQGLGWRPYLHATALAALAAFLAWRLGETRVLGAVAATALAALLWCLYLRRRMGGHSGDLLGAGNQLAEAAALLVLTLS